MFRYMLIVRIVELYALFACKINEKFPYLLLLYIESAYKKCLREE